MKKILHMITFILLLCVLLGAYYLYGSYRDAHIEKKTEKINNIYIASVSGSSIQVVVDGETRGYSMAEAKEEIPSGLANIELTEGVVTKVAVMPDTVQGKVLSVSSDGIEIEGYGDLKLCSNFKVYQLGDKVTMSSAENIIVGYNNTKFVVVNGKIQGAIIQQGLKADNIRVLLKTSDFSSYDHEKVKVTATADFTVTADKETKDYPKGTEVDLNEKKRYLIKSPQGRITILTLKRHNNAPSYRGTVEVRAVDKRYHIINELPLEQYLYSVVPSEMPVTYGAEALKVQAVCARSYGYGQILENKLSKYGAHVDDSVSFQVYNNVPESEDARKQVDATRGQVVMNGEKVATTYFFSTTCGLTSSAKDVWYTKKEVSYLISKSQIPGLKSEDYTNEKNFSKFISEKKDGYDSDSIWYRWNVTIKANDIKTSIEKNILSRYKINPSHIQVKTGNRYKSKEINSIGDVKEIKIIKRGAGGVAKTAEVVGSKATIRIFSEYNIRLLLSGVNIKVTCQTGDKIGGLSLLPSGFFVVSKKGDSFTFKGGGFGHGVGMSQNGAKKLAKMGKKYNEIIGHYYPGTRLQSIY